MNYNFCRLCNRKIAGISYSNKVYCSGKCRHYAYMARRKGMSLQEAENRVNAELTTNKREGEQNGRGQERKEADSIL